MPITLRLSLPNGIITTRVLYAPSIKTLAQAVRDFATQRGVSVLAVDYQAHKGSVA